MHRDVRENQILKVIKLRGVVHYEGANYGWLDWI